MAVPSTIPFPAPLTPLAVDAAATRRAAAELAGLIEVVGPESVAGLVLRQAHRELASLVRGAAPAGRPADVVGPVRVRVAA